MIVDAFAYIRGQIMSLLCNKLFLLSFFMSIQNHLRYYKLLSPIVFLKHDRNVK